MNRCHLVESDLVELGRGRGNAGPARTALDEHLGGCADCRARLDRERTLTAALGDLRDDAALEDAPPDLERRLLEAFASPRSSVASGRGRSAPAWWALAAAATLVLAVAGPWSAATLFDAGTPASRVGSPGAGGQPSGVAAAGASPAAARDGGVAATGTGAAPRATPEGRRAPSRTGLGPDRSGPVNAQVDDVLTFLPLPAAAGLPALESGRIVRVELPPEALPAYGFEPLPDVARAPVGAYMLVGQDGLPRAIRLVTTAVDSRRIR